MQFFFVDEGVVDAVDVEFAEGGVGDDVFFGSHIVFETEGFEEVHIDDGGSGGDYYINHLVADHVNVNLHAACCTG